MTRPRLYLSHDADYDWLIALEFGVIDDGQPSENWRRVTDDFGFLHDGPGEAVLGFKVVDFAEFDLDADEAAEVWEGPRFDVPVLGLTDVTAGEVMAAARPFFDGRSSLNRLAFDAAVHSAADKQQALRHWQACLQAGDSMAHFGLGYTLYDLGRHREAYRHLRHYTELAPACTWAWCWYGYAAEAVGEPTEARRAYERAIELEQAGEDETDAAERLAALEG